MGWSSRDVSSPGICIHSIELKGKWLRCCAYYTIGVVSSVHAKCLGRLCRAALPVAGTCGEVIRAGVIILHSM